MALWGLGAVLGLLACVALIGHLAWTHWQHAQRAAPTPAQIEQAARMEASVVLAADGSLLRRLDGGAHQPVTLDRVSPHLIAALLATEDRRFFEHEGIDWRRLVKVGAEGAWSGDFDAGASTLTQQLARNLFPQSIGRTRSLERKAVEAVAARRIEAMWSKPQILEQYLNQVSFGRHTRGVDAGARLWFGKPAADLDPAEAALMVALLKGPTRYDPIRQPQRALERRNAVLAIMAQQGHLAQAEGQAAQARPLPQSAAEHRAAQAGPAPHFVDHVLQQAERWAAARGMNLAQDGLRIQTTLDPVLQAAAEGAVAEEAALLQRVAAREWTTAAVPFIGKRQALPVPTADRPGFDHFWRAHRGFEEGLLKRTPEFAHARDRGLEEVAALQAVRGRPEVVARVRHEATRLTAGMVVLEPATGAVRAWVGSPHPADEALDHVAATRRQPGSAFKPFVYGAAVLRGIGPTTLMADAAPTLVQADGRTWAPRNGGGSGAEDASITVADALARSRNGVTVQLGQWVGPDSVAQLARAMGVRQSPLNPVPSLALGTSEVTLLELTSAYATLAADGLYRAPQGMAAIYDRHGQLLEAFIVQPERVLGPGSAATLLDMLRGPVTNGTAQALRSEFQLKAALAGKTGTSQRNADGWFVALTPQYSVGAWVGFNERTVHLRSNRWGHASGNALRMVGAWLQRGERAGWVDRSLSFTALTGSNGPLPPGLAVALDADDVSVEGDQKDAVDAQNWAPKGPDAPLSDVRRGSDEIQFEPPGAGPGDASPAAPPQQHDDAPRVPVLSQWVDAGPVAPASPGPVVQGLVGAAPRTW